MVRSEDFQSSNTSSILVGCTIMTAFARYSLTFNQTQCLAILLHDAWNVNSVGRVSPLQGESHWFESNTFHQ